MLDGFQIAVQHAILMGVINGFSDGLEQACRKRGFKRPVAKRVRQTLAGQFHAVKMPARLLAHLVDGDNVRMMEPARRRRLRAKARDVRRARE